MLPTRTVFAVLAAAVCIVGIAGGAVTEVPSGAGCTVDVAFVVENSATVGDSDPTGGENWNVSTGFLQMLVDLIKVGPSGGHFGLVEFGNQGYLGFDFSAYTTEREVNDALDRLKYRGENANLTGGLRLARERLFDAQHGMRPNASHVIILMTVGIPPNDSDELQVEVDRIKNQGIKIIAVGFTKKVNETFLLSIASPPSERNYMYFEDTSALGTVIMELCSVPPPAEECKVADVAFVVDNSGSIRDTQEPGQDNWKLVVDFLVGFVQRMDVGPHRTRIGLVEFGNRAYFGFDFVKYTTKQDVVEALNRSLKFRGENTNTTGGMRLARERLFNTMYGMRENVPHVMLLITDGVPTFDSDKLDEEVRKIKDAGIRIMAVGVTNKVNDYLLRSIVTKPSESNYVYVNDFGFLDNLLNMILADKMCNKDGTTVQPPTTAVESVVDLRLSSMGSLPATSEVCIADVAFVVDNSENIGDSGLSGQEHWNLIVQFLKALVSMLDVGQDRTRIGLVEFGDQGYLPFDFNAHKTAQEVVSALNGTQKRSGENGNTTGGLRLAREKLFDVKYGMRPNVSHVLLLVTFVDPTIDADKLQGEVDRIKNMGIRIMAVGVNKVNAAFLKSIVTHPVENNYFEVGSLVDLPSLPQHQPFLDLDRCNSETDGVTTRPPTATNPWKTLHPTSSGIGSCFNMMILLDSSDYVEHRNFDIMKLFSKNVVTGLDLDECNGMRIGVASFSDGVKQEIRLNEHESRSISVNSIDALRFSGGRRNTGDALKQVCEGSFAVSAGSAANASCLRLVLLVTNGASISERNAVLAASKCKRSGIHIMVVAVGNWLNVFEINNMASWPHAGNTFFYPNFAGLRNASVDVLRNLVCNRNPLECSSNPCRNGGTCVDLISAYVCLCTAGFAGTNCEQSCNDRADVVFALDASGSCGPDDFQRQLDFVSDMAVALNLHGSINRMAAVSFADEGVSQFDLDTFDNVIGVVDGIAQPYPRGGTNTAVGLHLIRQAMENQTRPGVTKIGVVVTDGRSKNLSATLLESSLARAEGIALLTVAVGPYTDDWELKDISSEPSSKNCFAVSNFDSLKTIENDLLQTICQNEKWCRNRPCMHGGECIDTMNGYECRCPPGYTGTKCERECDGYLDICIVLDASGSIRNERFPEVLKLVVNVTDQFEVSPMKTRFAALKYSDDAVWLFGLDTYASKQDVKTSIRRATFMGGRTNLASAFEMMSTRIFNHSAGDRPDVPNVALFLSDGKSNVHPELSSRAAVEARNQGIHIITFGVGTDVNTFEMRNMASEPKDDNVFVVSSQRYLPSLLSGLVMATCDNVNTCASNPCLNGGTCRRYIKRFECECKRFYSGDRCEHNYNTSCKVDVVFALDVSGSTEDGYEEMLNFTRQTIRLLPVSGDAARVAIITFSHNATILFDLDAYQTPSSIRNALVFDRSGGETNIRQAVALAHQSAFRGDRPNARSVLVVVTDGRPTVDVYGTPAEVATAKLRGFHDVLAVGIEDVDEVEMRRIFNASVILVQDSTDITSESIGLVNRLCGA